MSAWSWIRTRRWYWQLLLALAGLPVSLVALYVAGRSLQYWAAEGDAGVFVPADAQGVLRLRELERHLGRLEDSLAWRTLKRKVLGSPAIRPLLNGALQDAGLPTLDDLEDVRKASLYSRENLVRAAGRDFALALRVGDEWTSTRFCIVTRLRWSDYLLTPFARFVFPQDQGALRTPGTRPFWVAFEGSLAIAANNPGLLGEARQGRGKAPPGTRPVEFRLRLGGSRALEGLRESLRGSGTLPYVKAASIRGVAMGADVDGGTLLADLELEGAEPERDGVAAPMEVAAWAPSISTGVFATSAALPDLHAWLRSLGLSDLNSELDRFDKYGFSAGLLPRLDAGMALVLGSQEGVGGYSSRLFPVFVLFVPSAEPQGAATALSETVGGVGGALGRAWMKPLALGAMEGASVELPEALGVGDFVKPCWLPVPGGLLFGNNEIFLQTVAAAAGGGAGGLREKRSWKRLQARLKELGFPTKPGLMGGVFFPPAIRESLDGFVRKLAANLTYTPDLDQKIRAELDAEVQAAGQPPLTTEQAVPIVNERREAKIRDRESLMRADLAVMDAAGWAALSSSRSESGISLRFALGFDSLNDR